MSQYILALDQGTTSSRAVIFDKDFNILGIEQEETTQIFPKHGWVEQDATEIWETQLFVARKLIARLGINTSEIASIGITNQRETTVVWDKKTGKPIYNAIIWQDNRTAEFCNKINNDIINEYIRKSTGLVIDSYFSATKLHWIINNVTGVKQKAENGDLLFGTIDSWLIWNLSGGKLHITDYSNASRTLLYNIKELKWDNKILDYLEIPKKMLPKVVDSSKIYGNTAKNVLGKTEIVIGGIAGDQQAALFGQNCFEQGSVKNTYGTGCFILMNTGQKPVESKAGLLSTIAWGINGNITYALEGSVFIAGAVIQWLRDELKIIKTAQETESLAFEVEDNGGVYFIPAFAGLGAPYWDMSARGMLIGLSRGTNYKHIVRAAIESMAFQTRDVLEAMKKDSGISPEIINADGGASKNNYLMQFQSDILNINVMRPHNTESTALGVAYLAALAVGFCKIDDVTEKRKIDKVFSPLMEQKNVNLLYSNWLKAIEKAKAWGR